MPLLLCCVVAVDFRRPSASKNILTRSSRPSPTAPSRSSGAPRLARSSAAERQPHAAAVIAIDAIERRIDGVDGGVPRSKQRYFTEEQLKRIIEAARGQYHVLFAVLAGTGMRIGEAAGLYVEDVDIQSQVVHVRRSIWKGEDLAPKTENAIREVDIDETLTQMLRLFIGKRKAGRLFQSRTG